jgi:carbonic anhydrase
MILGHSQCGAVKAGQLKVVGATYNLASGKVVMES